MPEYQTTVQDLGAILRGSGMLEIAAVSATPSYVDVGAIQGLKFSEELEVNAEENDNTDSTDRVTKQTAVVSATLMEPISDAIRTLMRGDLDTRSSVAAAKVNDHDQTVASGDWAFNQFIECDYQNADGSVLQIDAQGYADVSGSVDGALVNVTDYDMVKINGKWGIIIKDSATVTTEAQALTISYDYTPAASVTYKTGNKADLTKFQARITTKNDDNTYIIEFYYGNIRKGMSLEYSKDDDNDRRVGMPIELIFKTLPSGSGAAANEGMVYGTTQISGF